MPFISLGPLPQKICSVLVCTSLNTSLLHKFANNLLGFCSWCLQIVPSRNKNLKGIFYHVSWGGGACPPPWCHWSPSRAEITSLAGPAIRQLQVTSTPLKLLHSGNLYPTIYIPQSLPYNRNMMKKKHEAVPIGR